MPSRRVSASALVRSKSTPKALKEELLANSERWKSTGRDGVNISKFLSKADVELGIASRKILAGSYRFSPYRQVIYSKGRDKLPRVVSVATIRDKVVLNVLLKTLKSVFPEAVPERAQRKIRRLKNEYMSGRYDAFVKVDVVNFYPTISHGSVEQALRKRIRSPLVMDLFLRAIQTPTLGHSSQSRFVPERKGVPQGLSVSNLLAELALADLDASLSLLPSSAVFRYVDDIIVLCRFGDVPSVWKAIQRDLRSVGVEVHALGRGSKSHTGRISEPFEYLGYRFHERLVSVRSENRARIENRLARAFTTYKYASKERPSDVDSQTRCLARLEWDINIAVSGCIWRNRRLGWLAYFSHINDFELLNDLDRRVRVGLRRAGISTLRLKKFASAYWAINNAHSDRVGFVPNFDNLTMKSKREMLIAIFDVPGAIGFTPMQVEATFSKIIDRVADDLEKDIGFVS